MLEMNIKIEAPELVNAITKLFNAIAPHNPTLTPADSVTPPAPTPVVPVSSGVPAIQTPPAVPTPSAPPASEVPVTNATYTLDQISKAGATLVDMGKMEALLALLGKYGVAAVTQLPMEQYGSFATELRALGAQI